MFKLTCSFLFLLTLLSCGNVTNDKDKERIDSICDDFMQTFQQGNVSGAMQLLKQNSVIGNSAIDTLEVTVKDQLDKVLPAYGNILSYEFISEHKIKSFISKRFYILKFDKYYLKFDFTMYNNGKGWTITAFNFNDELLELLY